MGLLSLKLLSQFVWISYAYFSHRKVFIRSRSLDQVAIMPIYWKNLIKIFFSRTNGLETLVCSIWEIVLYRLYKWWPWIDPACFMARSKFGPLGFWIGKGEKGNVYDCEISAPAGARSADPYLTYWATGASNFKGNQTSNLVLTLSCLTVQHFNTETKENEYRWRKKDLISIIFISVHKYDS